MQNHSNLTSLVGRGKNNRPIITPPYTQQSSTNSLGIVPNTDIQIPLPNVIARNKRRRKAKKQRQAQLHEFEDNPLFISFEDSKESEKNKLEKPNQTPTTSKAAQNSAKQVNQEKDPKSVNTGGKMDKTKTMQAEDTSAPWMTDEIKELIKMKKKAQAEYKRNNTEANHKKYVFLRNSCNHHCKMAQRKYMYESGNPKNSSDLASPSQETGMTPTVFERLQPKKQVAYQPTEILHVNTDTNVTQSQLYSPTEVCMEDTNDDELQVPDLLEPGQKRLSAFDRLGPLTPTAQTKKPKLTINLNMKKDQPVREVVEESAQPVYVPFHEREDVINSTDEVVMKYLRVWPWKKPLSFKKSVTARSSKSVMLMEKEQVEEAYARDNNFILVSIKGYPPSWTKEDVLDVLLANLKGKSFIPCFIEFTKEECKCLVNRSRMALLEIHALGFFIRQRDSELALTISLGHLTTTQLDFLPRAVLRRLLALRGHHTRLDLRAFTLQKDLSHFIYFPLNRIYNQRELVQLQGGIDWKKLTELDLSHNRLKSLDGFNLATSTPNLQTLDLSHNHISTLPTLISCRGVPVKKLWLEGNPLCLDYIDPTSYIETVRMIFTSIRELDGESITLRGDIPKFKKNFCPEEAAPVVEKFLETFFPLLDAPDRDHIENMYDNNAILTITFRNKLRYDADNIRFKQYFRYLFLKSRILEQQVYEYVRGATNIRNVVEKWPRLMHDPTTFTVDVLHHTDDSTVLKVAGVLKIVADSLAEDEPLLAFSRTLLLHTTNHVEYKIKHEMLYWDEPTKEYADSAFKLIRIRNQHLELKFDSTPDENVQEELIDVFMKLTKLEAKQSRRCLESKDWHLKNALEYFVKLLKLDNVGVLDKTDAI